MMRQKIRGNLNFFAVIISWKQRDKCNPFRTLNLLISFVLKLPKTTKEFHSMRKYITIQKDTESAVHSEIFYITEIFVLVLIYKLMQHKLIDDI